MKRPQKLAVMLVPTPPYEICGLDEAAVHEFLVDVHARCREHDGGGAFDVVFLGFHAAGVRVFSGARDAQFLLGLQ